MRKIDFTHRVLESGGRARRMGDEESHMEPTVLVAGALAVLSESDSNGGVTRQLGRIDSLRQSLDTSGKTPHQDDHQPVQHGPARGHVPHWRPTHLL
jgi:hypothetical protein